jgi:hypothetical protein
MRQRVFERDRGRCGYCHLLQIGQAAVFHINHIVPKSKGGGTEEGNLVLQCPHCSLHKSDKINAADPASGEIVELFHPLQQRWTEHFAMDASGECRGLTPTGRATIGALGMNGSLPRIARVFQIHLGLLATEI